MKLATAICVTLCIKFYRKRKKTFRKNRIGVYVPVKHTLIQKMLVLHDCGISIGEQVHHLFLTITECRI